MVPLLFDYPNMYNATIYQPIQSESQKTACEKSMSRWRVVALISLLFETRVVLMLCVSSLKNMAQTMGTLYNLTLHTES